MAILIMNTLSNEVKTGIDKSTIIWIVLLLARLRTGRVYCLYIFAIGLWLCFPKLLIAEGVVDLSAATAITAGSIRQRDLLASKNGEIIRLRDELMAAEAILEQLRLQLLSQNNKTPSSDRNSNEDSTSSTEIPASTVSGEVKRIALGNRWFVQVSSIGPENYINLVKAKSIQRPLPTEADCETFSRAFEQNSELIGKLKVNGFPVTSFWALRSNGTMGLCRVNRVSSQRFRAAISSATPSRSDKAIALVSR